MRHTHIQALMGGLEKESSVISLPQHQKRLRAQLLAAYDCQNVRPSPRQLPSFTAGQQLVKAAAAKVERMNPDKIATLSREHERIDICLTEAMQSDSLHIATSRELNELLPAGCKKTYPAAWVYVVYINEHRRRVVIALDIYNEPLFIDDEERI